MSKLIIEKLNASFLRVYSDDFGIEQEVSEFFSYPVEGAKFMPMYKSGVWDGIHRMYNRQKKTLLFGLYDTLIKFCIDNNIDYESSVEFNTVQETDDELLEFIESLEIAKDGEKIELRDYQFEAIIKSMRDGRITLKSPTSSGKSAIAYVLARYALSKDLPLLLLVPNQGLVNQLFADFEDYSSVNNWDVREHVQKIMGGYSKEDTHMIKISTWQSMLPISKSNPNYFKTFLAVMVDECVHPNSKISMGDGSFKHIKDVRTGDYVKTINENTNQIESKKVLKVHHNLSVNQQMYEIELINDKKINITGNHKVNTMRGWVRADELTDNDEIINI